MQKELLIICVPPVGWILYSLGGYKQKFWRRIILPLFIGVIALVNGMDIYRSFITAALLSVSFHLGYGDTKSWVWRAFVGCCYAGALLPLGISPILLTIPITFLVTFWLSRRLNAFSWKIAEGLVGLNIGIALIFLI